MIRHFLFLQLPLFLLSVFGGSLVLDVCLRLHFIVDETSMPEIRSVKPTGLMGCPE
jgi:hypothetical protein